MTVQTETSRSGPYAGAGTTGPFTVGFRFIANAHLRVIRTTAAGIDSTLTLNTDYTVSGAGGSTGTVTLTSALASGEKLTIVRDVPFTQNADYVPGDAFPAESHEDALDLLTMQTQQLAEAQGRALTLPVTVSGASTELPSPSGLKVFGWNEAGTAIENLDANTLASIIAYGTAASDLFDGDGVTTAFSLSGNPASINNLDVSIGGVAQRPGLDYLWTSGTIVTFTTAPAVGTDNILVRYMQALAMGSSVASDVSYTPAGVGAAVTTVQAKLRESVSVKDFGAVGDGVTDDTAAIQAADAVDYANVTDQSLIALGTTGLKNGLLGASLTASVSDARIDKPTLAIYSTTTRPSRAKVKGLKITGNTADTVNDYSDLSTVSEFSHYIENHLEDVGSGVNVSYGPASIGSYAGSISADPGWENQPLRCSVGATVAFNNVKTTSWLGYEIFCANHSRVVGNGVWNSTASQQHGYRFTGYPGGPCQFNSAASNTARLVQNGLSIQVATRFNSLSGFVTESPTSAGVQLVSNESYPSWHHTNNFVQGISYQGTHGVYAAKPQYNHIQHIVDGATTFGVHFDATGTYGANLGNLLDAVVTNSQEGASINSSQNIIRLVTSNLTARGLVVAGSGNIIDLVVDRSGSFALQMSGSQNQLRISTTQTAATVDLSISGSRNLVHCMLGGSITVSGSDNKFIGFANLTGTTNIANSGSRNDFSGISNASGMVYTAGTGAVTDASGDVTVTTPTRPTMSGLSYIAMGQIVGGTLVGHSSNYMSAVGQTGFKFRIYNAAGVALGAGVSVVMVVQYGIAINPQP